MAECIEKAAVLSALASEGITRNMRVFRKIQDIPTGEMAPVRHGRWVGEEVDLDGHTAMECSRCHRVRIIDDYCSACGAKMDGEGTEK